MMRRVCVVIAALMLAVLPDLFVPPAHADGSNGTLDCAIAGVAAPAPVVTADLQPGGRGAVVVPVAGKPVPRPLPAGTMDGLQAVRGKAESIRTQARSLEARLNQRDWRQAVQSQLGTLRGTQASLQQDVLKLQTANRSANLAEGIRLTNNLQRGVAELGKVVDGLAQARDLTSARGYVSRIAVSVDGIIKSVSDEPLCCELRTCCYVGIR